MGTFMLFRIFLSKKKRNFGSVIRTCEILPRSFPIPQVSTVPQPTDVQAQGKPRVVEGCGILEHL